VSTNESRLDNPVSSSRRHVPLPGVPGLIEGSMTIQPEPGGTVSFRVMVGAGGGQSGQHDLIELIIGAEDIGHLSQALAGHYSGQDAESTGMPPFPCHIGFCRNAVNDAA
jgi:hypothetical protein